MQSCSITKIQINTSLHRGPFSFSLPKPWKVAAAQRDVSFAISSWAWGWPSPAMQTPHDANSEGDSTPSSVTLRDFVSCTQLEQRLLHYAQSPGLYSAKRWHSDPQPDPMQFRSSHWEEDFWKVFQAWITGKSNRLSTRMVLCCH